MLNFDAIFKGINTTSGTMFIAISYRPTLLIAKKVVLSRDNSYLEYITGLLWSHL